VLNAANEVAVDAFLNGRLPFTGIAGVISETLGAVPASPVEDLAAVMRVDEQARRVAQTRVMALAA
jgi:1-deoxy-D-xylulose-5-phosphate reductoisomerase